MSQITYLDFDLLISRSGRNYRAQVLDSPSGQASIEFRAPFTRVALENFILRIGVQRRGMRRIDTPETEAAKQFGAKLFSSVFAGDVLGCLRSSMDDAQRQGANLRIRLHLAPDAADLADLPWEYLYNPALNRFLALSVHTPLVHYIDLPERIQPLTVQAPLRVLAMVSSPRDFPSLDAEREWHDLEEALAGLQANGSFELERLEHPTLDALQQRLRRGKYHILHFVGHGGFDERAEDGVIVLEDEDGRGVQVSGQQIGVLLHNHTHLRLAVLNACEGGRTSATDPFAGTAQTLLQQGIPAVIAMQFEISDAAAITFSSEFYSALADGYPVDAAVTEARNAIFARDRGIEWGTPVLYMRAPDGRIFDVQQPAGKTPTKERVLTEAQDIVAGKTGEADTRTRADVDDGVKTGGGEGKRSLERDADEDGGGIAVLDKPKEKEETDRPAGGGVLDRWNRLGVGQRIFAACVPLIIIIGAVALVFALQPHPKRVLPPAPIAYHYVSQWGSSGTGVGQFKGPTGLAVDHDGNIYVADYNGSRLEKFTPDGTYLSELSFKFAVQAVTVNQSGDVFVALCTFARNRCLSPQVSEFTPGLQFLRGWKVPNNPLGIAVDNLGTLYVADGVSDGVLEIKTSANTQTSINTPGTLPGTQDFPAGITVDGKRNVYVTEYNSNRILKLRADGTPLAAWGRKGSRRGEFNNPVDVKLDAHGNVFIADAGNNRIQELSPSGAVITVWGSKGSGNGKFNDPQAVAIDAHGNVYVADFLNNRIEKFAP